MVKRDITETVYEYDKEGKLIRKTVTETHEEEEGTSYTYPLNPCPNTTPNDNWWKYPCVTWSNDTTSDLTATKAQNNPTTQTTTTIIN